MVYDGEGDCGVCCSILELTKTEVWKLTNMSVNSEDDYSYMEVRLDT